VGRPQLLIVPVGTPASADGVPDHSAASSNLRMACYRCCRGEEKFQDARAMAQGLPLDARAYQGVSRLVRSSRSLSFSGPIVGAGDEVSRSGNRTQ
jgi:hypothetical protein